METKNIRIGDILINTGFIKEEQLQEALAYQKVDKSKRLGAIWLTMAMSARPNCWRPCPNG